MKLPKSLHVGYNMLKRSRLILRREVDDDSLNYFNSIMNEALPRSADDAIYYFVKGMYNENKAKFISFIRNTNLECLVLWTDSRAIVRMLGLRGLVYIKWVGREGVYQISRYNSPDQKQYHDEPRQSYKDSPEPHQSYRDALEPSQDARQSGGDARQSGGDTPSQDATEPPNVQKNQDEVESN